MSEGRPHVTHLVRSDSFSGVEAYVCGVAGGLLERGWRVTVVGGEGQRMRAALPPDVDVVPADSTVAVLRAARRSRADLLHAHMTAAELAGVLEGARSRRPVVSTRHFAAARGASLPGRAASVVVRRRLARQIAISRFVAAQVGEPTVVVPNGVPTRPAARGGTRTVVAAQRLEREKDGETLVRGWAASGLGERGWRLLWAGRGADEHRLRELSSDLAGVELLGFRDDLATLMDQADLFVATAPAEPFGLAVAEAMAAALPVVAADGGAHPELLGEATGLVEPGDPSALGLRLRALAEDTEAARAYGARLQQRQRREYDLDVHVERLVEVYASVLG